jgi:hypothetical protein
MAWIAFGDQVGGLDLTGLGLVFLGVSLTYIPPSSSHPKKR